jgi:hypothetical protein
MYISKGFWRWYVIKLIHVFDAFHLSFWGEGGEGLKTRKRSMSNIQTGNSLRQIVATISYQHISINEGLLSDSNPAFAGTEI